MHGLTLQLNVSSRTALSSLAVLSASFSAQAELVLDSCKQTLVNEVGNEELSSHSKS